MELYDEEEGDKTPNLAIFSNGNHELPCLKGNIEANKGFHIYHKLAK